jgi:hypothetical protein
MTDENTLASYTVGNDGSLNLASQQDAYWYSQFGPDACYDTTTVNATAIEVSVSAPAGTQFRVTMRWMTSSDCTGLSDPSSVDITSYITFTDANVYHVAQIPFTDFPGLISKRINSVALAAFSPTDVDVRVGCISLISIAAESPSNSQTCTCPSTAWLNYCVSGVAKRNAYGGAQSDDGTMSSPPTLNNGALDLKPADASSYWYSLQNCVDVSAFTTLYLNVTAKADATFDIQLQSGANDCSDTTQLEKAIVHSASYAAMNSSPVLLSIPLTDFTAANGFFSAKTLYAVVLEGFSDADSTYSLHCSYFGNGTMTTMTTTDDAAKVR